MDSEVVFILNIYSKLEITGNCYITDNHAIKGGGIYSRSSIITVHKPGTLQFINDSAVIGGGAYLEVNSVINVVRLPPVAILLLAFIGNHANYGGAIFVADNTSSVSCSSDEKCFIQVLTLNFDHGYITESIFFSNNTATNYGSSIFGGMLDRCIPSPFAEYWPRKSANPGISYLSVISNIKLHSIASPPVQVCFCTSEGEPDCNYQPPPKQVKKGEIFTVSLVALDQAHHIVDVTIKFSCFPQWWL